MINELPMNKNQPIIYLEKKELMIAYALCAFFFSGVIVHHLTIVFNLENTFFDSRTRVGYIRFTHTIIFLTCIFNSFYENGRPIIIYNDGISWQRCKELKENGIKSILLFICAIIYNPFVIFKLYPAIWAVFDLLIFCFFIREIKKLVNNFQNEKVLKKKGIEDELVLKGLFEKVDYSGIENFCKERGRKLDFKFLVFGLVEYKSKEYVIENSEELKKEWELYTDWNDYPTDESFEKMCNAVIKEATTG